jgi:hypothetical protein
MTILNVTTIGLDICLKKYNFFKHFFAITITFVSQSFLVHFFYLKVFKITDEDNETKDEKKTPRKAES